MIWRIIEILSLFIEIWILVFLTDRCIGIKQDLKKWKYPWIILMTIIMSILNSFSILDNFLFFK